MGWRGKKQLCLGVYILLKKENCNNAAWKERYRSQMIL